MKTVTTYYGDLKVGDKIILDNAKVEIKAKQFINTVDDDGEETYNPYNLKIKIAPCNNEAVETLGKFYANATYKVSKYKKVEKIAE